MIEGDRAHSLTLLPPRFTFVLIESTTLVKSSEALIRGVPAPKPIVLSRLWQFQSVSESTPMIAVSVRIAGSRNFRWRAAAADNSRQISFRPPVSRSCTVVRVFRAPPSNGVVIQCPIASPRAVPEASERWPPQSGCLPWPAFM